MFLYHILILALIQGITEFLPISSSGHLALTHIFMGNDQLLSQNQRLLIDVAVHVGTLFAVLVYFYKDVLAMLKAALSPQKQSEGRNLLLKIIIGSIPVILAGYFVKQYLPNWLGSLEIVAWMTLIFGVVLWVADRNPNQFKTSEDLTLKGAFAIGCAQVLALIPGVSRSGITMTMGRFLKMSASEAARFSLFLGMVAISGAGFLGTLDLLDMQDLDFGMDILVAIVLSFISGLAAITLMLSWLQKNGFGIFILYRIVLGGGLLILIYGFPNLF